MALPGPVELGLPLRTPRPVDGCRVCAASASRRAQARECGDFSAVSDCNVEISAHERRH